jgi:hypothetical protein
MSSIRHARSRAAGRGGVEDGELKNFTPQLVNHETAAD